MTKITLKEYNELLRDIKKANQRIQRMQSRYGEGSWAISELYDKIDNKLVNGISSISGNIRIPKNATEIQLKAIEKATKNFLSSQTSTLLGVRKAIKNMKKSIKAQYSDMGKQLTDSEAEKLYSFLENKDTRGLVEQIGASETWARTIQAKEQKLTKNEYINLFENRINIKDRDVRNELETLYNKYMM